MPVDGGPSIPFPGPPGVTYPAGTVIDCGMRFDSFDTWSTSDVPDPSGFDVQSVATHEGGTLHRRLSLDARGFHGDQPDERDDAAVCRAWETRRSARWKRTTRRRCSASTRGIDSAGRSPRQSAGVALINLTAPERRSLRAGNRRVGRGLSDADRDRRTEPGRDVQRIAAARGSRRTSRSMARSTLNVPPLPAGRVLHHLRQNVETGTGSALLAALQLHDDQLQPAGSRRTRAGPSISSRRLLPSRPASRSTLETSGFSVAGWRIRTRR